MFGQNVEEAAHAGPNASLDTGLAMEQRGLKPLSPRPRDRRKPCNAARKAQSKIHGRTGERDESRVTESERILIDSYPPWPNRRTGQSVGTTSR